MNVKRQLFILAQFTLIGFVCSEFAFEMYLRTLPDYSRCNGFTAPPGVTYNVQDLLLAQWNRFDRWIIFSFIFLGLLRIGLLLLIRRIRGDRNKHA